MSEKILLMRQDLFTMIIKEKKGIYGIASKDEIKELKEEGIQASTIPWIEDKKLIFYKFSNIVY